MMQWWRRLVGHREPVAQMEYDKLERARDSARTRRERSETRLAGSIRRLKEMDLDRDDAPNGHAR